VRFRSLGSGSEGNALIVEAADTTVLIDAGFASAELERRLARAQVQPSDIDAILVTHEHGDHARGVARFARRHDLPVIATYGTIAAMGSDWQDVRLRHCDSDEVFLVGHLEIRAFAVPHDAREPVQYVLSDDRFRLGVLTDVGHVTGHIIGALSACDALFLEANHCEELLATGPYPPSLKERVGGRYGHLSNAQAAEALAAVSSARLQHVVAAHLSQQNNTPERAVAAFASALGNASVELSVASQEAGCPWIMLT
jgi:phosphoribosyl 1,2-cyclic phosphodiesterase